MLESEMLGPVARHFEASGYETFAEVPVACRRADLVAVSPADLLAVELKLDAWPRALRQAMAYQVWATRSFVLLPFPAAHRAARHRYRFEAEGVGLLALRGDDVRTFVDARPSPRRFDELGEWVRGLLASLRVPAAVRGPTIERF